MRPFLVALALVFAGCAEAPPPFTATRVLDVPGLRTVVNAVALSPDGGLVAVGDMEGALVAREVPSGAERWRSRLGSPRVERPVNGLAFSPDGSLLVATSFDAPTLRLWDAGTGRHAATLAIARPRGVAFHPTERVLVVAAATTLHVVDLDRAEVTRSLSNSHSGEAVYAVAFSADGQTLGAISEQGSLKTWSWPALALRASMSIPGRLESLAPVSLALTRDGTRAAANGILGRVHVVDTGRGREERAFANVPEAPGHAMHAELRASLAFTDDGEWLFAPDTHDRGLRILHVKSGKVHPVLRGEGPFYKAVAIVVPASLVALLRPGDGQGHGPYGLEVWRLNYRAR
jgi:WD40 repeat protein